MFAATQQQQAPPATASATMNTAHTVVPAPISAEDEALKRNTDCVYFLASPLTCKKGAECEYRHSEYARVNPRDCYYWLNSNCLNPKCGYRHPPLDALLGTPAATPTGSSFRPPQTIGPPTAISPYGTGKQAVPCIFFQKGLCVKGDRCAFSHGLNAPINKPPQPLPTTKEPQSQKKPFGVLEKCKTAQPNVPNAHAPASMGKTLPKVEAVLPRRNITNDVDPMFKPTEPSPIGINRLNSSHIPEDQHFQNGKDVDDSFRESSPGFDVLVDDDDHIDSDYYGSGRNREVGKMNNVDEYDVNLSADYSSIAADIDREYDYDRVQAHHAWDSHRASPERVHIDKRSYSKARSPERSDLRYRLSKRPVNGLKSVISHDSVSDRHVEERSYSSSSRLRGRINFHGSDLHTEREMNRGRNRQQLSPEMSSHHGRINDRIRGRPENNYRNPGGSRGTGFYAPRSLAELKAAKNTDDNEHQALGKRKHWMDRQQNSEDDITFDGPMPLSEILKRKRQAKGSSVTGNKDIEQNESEKQEASHQVNNKEEAISTETLNNQVIEADDGMIVNEGIEENEYEEGDEQVNEEYEYEPEGDEGEYEYEQEGENIEGEEEEEYLEEVALT